MPWAYDKICRSIPRRAARVYSIVQLYFLVFLDFFLSLEAFEGFFLFEWTTTGVSCSLSSFSCPSSSDPGSDLTGRAVRLALGFGLAFGLQFLELQWEGWGNMGWKSPSGKDQSNTRRAPATGHAGVELHVLLGCGDILLDKGFFFRPHPCKMLYSAQCSADSQPFSNWQRAEIPTQ